MALGNAGAPRERELCVATTLPPRSQLRSECRIIPHDGL
jgi:hypothetical protein